MKIKFDPNNLWNGFAWGVVLALSLGLVIWGLLIIFTNI